MKRINAINAGNIQELKELFELHIDCESLEQYRLPVADRKARVVVGLSGGADSTVLALFCALYLHPHYPNIEYLFTDTKAEPDSCYETLDAIERLTGITITRIMPDKGLFDLINSYNGFLPNSQARWCTRQLKIAPLMEYLDQNPSEHGHISLAGIRYDESDREGIQFQYDMEHASAAFPFVDLKITKTMVFDILHKSIGVPGTYQYRSRSGCYSCFFQRNQEYIGMLTHEPGAYAVTEAAEKLSADDDRRWNNQPMSLSDAGIRGYYPVPSFVDVRKPETTPEKAPQNLKVKKSKGNLSLFEDDCNQQGVDEEQLFVAFALYTDSNLAMYGGREFTPGVYWQEFITLSTTLVGLKAALGTYYKFKKTTPMSIYDVEDMVIVIAQIKFPKGVIDTAPPASDSYTWKSSIALKQLRNLTEHSQTALQYADLERQKKDCLTVLSNPMNEDAELDAMAQLDVIQRSIDNAPEASGRLTWEGLYIPTESVEKVVQLQLAGISTETDIKPARENLEYDEVPMACLACSI